MSDDQGRPSPATAGSLRGRHAAGWLLLGGILALVFAVTATYVVTPIIFGLFLYYGTRPIYRRLRQRSISKRAAAVVSLLAIGLPVLLITFLITVTALNEAVLLIEQGDMTSLQPLIDNLGIEYTDLTQYESLEEFVTSDGFRELVTGSWGAVSSLTNTLLGVVVSVLFSFMAAFFMYGWGPSLRRELLAVLNDEDDLVGRYVRNVDRDLAAVFFGNMLNAVVTSIIGALAYTGLNAISPAHATIPAPILLGLLTGIASFVPLVGSKLIYVPVTILLLFQSFTGGEAAGYGFTALFLGVALLIVDTLPDVVLRPLISGRTTSQGALFLGYLLGPIVFGFVGVFLMPMVIVLFLNFRRIILPGFRRPDAPDTPS